MGEVNEPLNPIEEYKKKPVLERLKEYRDRWQAGLTTDEVHSNSPAEVRYSRERKTWTQLVMSTLQMAVLLGDITDPEKVDMINDYAAERQGSLMFKRMTDEEDQNKTSGILNLFIGYLEEKEKPS